MATFLNSERSELNRPGPIRMPRPVLPNVPGALMAKALVLNHCRILAALGRSPGNAGLPTWSARSALIPLNELSIPEVIVNGRPVCRVTIPLACHPPSKYRMKDFPAANGRGQLND